MKRILVKIILVGSTMVLAGCSHSSREKEADAPTEKPIGAESRVKRGTNGEIIITLDAATQKVMGLQVAPLAATDLAPEVKGFGRVLDPATLSTAIGEWVSAAAAADASYKEFARLKTLADQNNASARALETASASAARDTAQAAAARARLQSATSKAIADRPELTALAQRLSSGDQALVRIDLPAGDDLKTEPDGARLVALTAHSQPIEAKFVGPAMAVDPQTQGRGFLFLVESNQSGLVQGAAVTGFLKLSGDLQSGVTVPQNAVVRFNGANWIYLQTGGDTFQREAVALETPVEGGWFVHERLKPQDKVVIVGAQQLLSEELKGQGGGE